MLYSFLTALLRDELRHCEKEKSTQVRGFYGVFQSSCDSLRSHETTETN